MKLKPMEAMRLGGNLLFSAAAVSYTAWLYNIGGFDLLMGATLICSALISSVQLLTFFRRIGTLPAWCAMSAVFLLPILICKDAGTGLLIGTCAIAIPLAVSFFWPPVRRIAPLAKWGLPTAGLILLLGGLGYSGLHFDAFGFAPIQDRIAARWIAFMKETIPLMEKVYEPKIFKQMKGMLELLMKQDQAETIAFTILMMAVIAMFGIFFIAVFLADGRLKSEGEKRWCGSWSRLIPPRGISWIYILFYVFSGYAAEEILLPLNATVILFGFFYVFTAVYKLERFLAGKKVHGALRALLVLILFGAAYFSAGATLYSAYTILLFIGWWITTAPIKVAVIKK